MLVRETKRIPVAVEETIFKAGKMIPARIKPEADQTYKIDKVLSVREGINLSDRVTGTRYTCRISECEFYLFQNGSQWYIEQ